MNKLRRIFADLHERLFLKKLGKIMGEIEPEYAYNPKVAFAAGFVEVKNGEIGKHTDTLNKDESVKYDDLVDWFAERYKETMRNIGNRSSTEQERELLMSYADAMDLMDHIKKLEGEIYEV